MFRQRSIPAAGWRRKNIEINWQISGGGASDRRGRNSILTYVLIGDHMPDQVHNGSILRRLRHDQSMAWLSSRRYTDRIYVSSSVSAAGSSYPGIFAQTKNIAEDPADTGSCRVYRLYTCIYKKIM